MTGAWAFHYSYLVAEQKRQVEIQVMGQKFLVRSESDESYVARVAQFVDQRMSEVFKNTNSVSSLNVAILAAMNIADDYFRLREEKEKQLKGVEKRVGEMLELIDLQL